jgi:hypothetical protein
MSSRERATEDIKQRLLELMRAGVAVKDALPEVKRSRSWYEAQRRNDRAWSGLIDSVRLGVGELRAADVSMGEYTEFCEKYLNSKVWPHQRHIVDLLEGRTPYDLHDAMLFEPGSSGLSRLLVNVPPNHAKSMTVTINYVTYRICKDPNVRVIIVSKTQEQAKKFLFAIKQRLSHPRYAELQLAFGPVDGFKATSDQWSATKIYLGGDARDSGEKDPTIEALGMGGQIYGARADLIVLDDVVTLANAGEWPKQMDWIRQEVASRLGPDGQLLVVGTRVASQDLYRALRDPDHYADAEVPWTYLGMPAVLEPAPDPADWVTLWPISDQPFTDKDVPLPDGTFPRWTGERLARVRNEVGPTKWSMVYQQMDVEENSTFDPVAVRGCVDGMRKPGPLKSGAVGHPQNSEGFYRICAMDPAIAGDMAVVAYAVDRQSGDRWVMDMLVKTAPKPAEIRDVFYQWTDLFSPNEWIVEDNAFQGFLAQDEDIRKHLASRGVVMRSHHTGTNKLDPDFGVASMSSLFGSSSTRSDGRGTTFNKDNLIHLPDPAVSYGVKMLVEQLSVWSPLVKTKHRKQDTVMALWFAEIRAREVMLSSNRGSSWFGSSNFVSPRDEEKRMVVSLDDWASAGSPVQYL